MRVWQGMNISAITYGMQIQPNWVPIPYGARLSLSFKAGTLGGTVMAAAVYPNEGYTINASKVVVNLPLGVSATLLATIDGETYPILADAHGPNTFELEDLNDLGYMDDLRLVVTTTQTLPSDSEVVLLLYGKEVML